MARKTKRNPGSGVTPARIRIDETAGVSNLNPRFREHLKYYVLAGLAALCLVIYLQTIGFDFVYIDDDIYVFDNPFVARGIDFTQLKWALTAFHAANWHPLTWISHQLDASLFGMSAGGHHAVNVLFHILNSFLLFAVINRLTNSFWKSAMVAAIFAVHPTHVESVAWIAERKDVLSTLFWLLTTWTYLRFRADPGNKKMLWISIAAFALGLSAKPMLVSLPFTLILLDYWPLERFDKWNPSNLLPLVKEKLAYFALAAISAAVTIAAQKSGGAIQAIEVVSLSDRVANAILSYAKYVMMLVWPVNLGVWYPFENDFSFAQIDLSLSLIIVLTAVCIWQVRTRRYLFVGWFWFLGTLIPVIGILQVGRQALADRYTYIPYIGLTLAFVWLFSEIFGHFKLNKAVIATICGSYLIGLTVLSDRQASYWKTSETIFLRTLSITPSNYLIKNNYCNYLEKKNRLDEAAAQCISAISDNPTLPDAYNTLGTVQMKQNRFAEARLNFEKAVERNPAFVLAYANLSLVETNLNNIDEAVLFLKKAIEADNREFFDANRLVESYSRLAIASMKLKKYEKASELFEKAIEIDPNNVNFQRNLALALHLQGKSSDGIRILEEIVRTNNGTAEVYNTLGLIYANQGRKQEAVTMFQKALASDPNFTPAQSNLRKAMDQK